MSGGTFERRTSRLWDSPSWGVEQNITKSNQQPHRIYGKQVCNSLSSLMGLHTILKILHRLQTMHYFVIYMYRNLYLEASLQCSWHQIIINPSHDVLLFYFLYYDLMYVYFPFHTHSWLSSCQISNLPSS